MRKPIKLALANIMEGQEADLQVSELLEFDDSKPLSDEGMKKMIPMFVKGKTPDETHDCGHCSMLIPSGGCTIVEGDIETNGTCAYQAPSEKHAKEGTEHAMRMTKEQAQYAVMPEGKPINCSTCMFLDGKDCKLWMGTVEPGDCCMAHDSGNYK